jgi:hypothetical protein
MKAVIMPLNKFIYHYEKYDGSTQVDRFWNRIPRIHNLMKSKMGSIFIMTIFVFPVSIVLLIAIFGPFYVLWLIKGGTKYASSQGHKRIDYWIEKSKSYFFKSENKISKINILQDKQYSLVVYYSSSMIPIKEKQKKKFIERLEKMREKLNVKEVVEGNLKQDILDVIQRLNINVSESFFMTDGKIHLSLYGMKGLQIDTRLNLISSSEKGVN